MRRRLVRRVALAFSLASAATLLLLALLAGPRDEGVANGREPVVAIESEVGTARAGVPTRRARPAAALPPVSAVAPEPSRYPVPRASRGAPPPSLRGSEVDGDLRAGPDGHFAPDAAALALFDYYLSATGEEPLEVLRGRIVLEALTRLSEPAAGEAIAALDRYLAYREAARELASLDAAPADLDQRLQWIRELRREHLGPLLAEAFYAEEERVALLDLERREIEGDHSLDEWERQRRLMDIEARLPAHVRESRQQVMGPSSLRRDVAAARAQGAGEEEVFALREERYGDDAAERLAALDRRREDWQRRLAEYRAARSSLAAGAGPGDNAGRDNEIEALRASLFTPAELPRVRALEREGAL